MHYDFIAIADDQLPSAIEPAFQHVIDTYASETNKTASMWKGVDDEVLDYRPHDKVNSIRTIMVHQLLSERRFFSEFAGLAEPHVEQILPPGESPSAGEYLQRYIDLARMRLPQFAAGTSAWWLQERDFFGGLKRQRIWIVWRRILHTCHHRTQLQIWLRLAGRHVPAIYGPSGDVKWDAADPTYSLDAARRRATP